jgi:hypothetical protein
MNNALNIKPQIKKKSIPRERRKQEAPEKVKFTF